MKCPNEFTCHICKKEYHRATPVEQQLREHKERAEYISDYDLDDDTVEVCDRCFELFMEEVGVNDLGVIEEILRKMDKYWADKNLSEKCGLSTQEICTHDEWCINKGILICLNCGMKNEN